MVNVQTLKVGDKVRYLGDDKATKGYYIATIGEVYEITGFGVNFPRGRFAVITDDDGDDAAIPADNQGAFELVEDAQFKAGDSFRVLDSEELGVCGYVTDGDVYEVLRIDEDGDIVFTDDDGDDAYIEEDEFDFIEKVTDVAKEVEYEVGDFIEILDADAIGGAQDTTEGKAYEIIAKDGKSFLIVDDVDDELCILRSELKYIKKVVAPNTTGEPQVGDRITLTNGVHEGDSGTVLSVRSSEYEGRRFVNYEEGLVFESEKHGGPLWALIKNAEVVATPEKREPKAGDTIRFGENTAIIVAIRPTHHPLSGREFLASDEGMLVLTKSGSLYWTFIDNAEVVA